MCSSHLFASDASVAAVVHSHTALSLTLDSTRFDTFIPSSYLHHEKVQVSVDVLSCAFVYSTGNLCDVSSLASALVLYAHSLAHLTVTHSLTLHSTRPSPLTSHLLPVSQSLRCNESSLRSIVTGNVCSTCCSLFIFSLVLCHCHCQQHL